jgi:hypothetical protein
MPHHEPPRLINTALETAARAGYDLGVPAPRHAPDDRDHHRTTLGHTAQQLLAGGDLLGRVPTSLGAVNDEFHAMPLYSQQQLRPFFGDDALSAAGRCQLPIAAVVADGGADGDGDGGVSHGVPDYPTRAHGLGTGFVLGGKGFEDGAHGVGTWDDMKEASMSTLHNSIAAARQSKETLAKAARKVYLGALVQTVGGLDGVTMVGRCSLTVSKPVMKAPMVSAIETKIRGTAFKRCFQIQLAPLHTGRRQRRRGRHAAPAPAPRRGRGEILKDAALRRRVRNFSQVAPRPRDVRGRAGTLHR